MIMAAIKKNDESTPVHDTISYIKINVISESVDDLVFSFKLGLRSV